MPPGRESPYEGRRCPDHPKAHEWRHRLLLTTAGLLVFETLSGLSITLLPFSVANQVLVLLHTLGGIALLAPYCWYQIRHWGLYRSQPMTHVKLTGYFSMVTTAVALVTGIVLTWQALFGSRIVYGWSLAHLVATVGLIASAVPHVVVVVRRNLRARSAPALAPVLRAQRTFASGVSYFTLASFALAFAWTYAHRPIDAHHELPEDYNFLYGDDRPFAPSLARTSTGGAIRAEALGGSASCARCHEEIYREWEVSAHRWAAMDPAFRAIQTVMGEQNGAESTRYCGGCHDPISLFSGSKNLFRADLTNPIGLDEGVSCITCHAIKETDVKGNAAYTIEAPARYLYEMSEGVVAQQVSDFLIRAYPQQHVASLQHGLFKSPEFCAACHKQFIDEEINNVGWVQLQNQYDNWRKSRWNHPGEADRTIECRECHMPLVASFDPASGDPQDYNRSSSDGKHRSHRFLGANQFIPAHLDLPGADEQTRLTEAWLRGEIEIPEIAHKWKSGPVVPIELVVPDTVAPGETVSIDVIITNNKAGHDFPTGPLDIIQSWIEVVVTDGAGRELFSSGKLDPRHFVAPGTFMFKAEPVDQYGNLIDRHNLWEMVGVRYRRSLFPGFSDRASYRVPVPAPSRIGEIATDGPSRPSFAVPGDARDAVYVRARLLYRKIDQTLLNDLFGEESGITSPITEMSADERTIRLRSSGASPDARRLPGTVTASLR